MVSEGEAVSGEAVLRDRPDPSTAKTDQRASSCQRHNVPGNVYKRTASLEGRRASRTVAFDCTEQESEGASGGSPQEPGRSSFYMQSFGVRNQSTPLSPEAHCSKEVHSQRVARPSVSSVNQSRRASSEANEVHSPPVAGPSVCNAAPSVNDPVTVKEKVSRWLSSSFLEQETDQDDQGNQSSYEHSVLHVLFDHI